MNWAIVGLLLIGLAQGIASVACWNLLAHPVSRALPGVLTLAYYGAMWRWPHPSITAARTGQPYPDGDQVRLMLLGLALIVGIVLLVRALARKGRG